MKKNLEAEIVLTCFDTEAKDNLEMASNLMSGAGRPILLAVTRP